MRKIGTSQWMYLENFVSLHLYLYYPDDAWKKCVWKFWIDLRETLLNVSLIIQINAQFLMLNSCGGCWSEMEDGLDCNESKKSWTELKQTSCALRRQLSALSTAVPSLIKFRILPDGSTRIFFLGTLANGWENTLHYADVSSKDSKVCAFFISLF